MTKLQKVIYYLEVLAAVYPELNDPCCDGICEAECMWEEDGLCERKKEYRKKYNDLLSLISSLKIYKENKGI